MDVPKLRQLTRFSRNEIQQLFREITIRKRQQGIEFLLVPSSLQPHSKLLVIASRKMGNAVKRNRFRRRVKQIFYETKLYESGYHWIIIAKQPAALLLSFAVLKKLFSRIHPCTAQQPHDKRL